MLCKVLAEATQRGADEVVQRLPVAAQNDLPRLETHQVEHV